jgi:adenine-specific DNA methylase
VIYSECADFFYVWLKRTFGALQPTAFAEDLTNIDEEAVANWARFREFGKKKQLARQDYERKMAAAFRELHRVLQSSGILAVMFTHKEVEAWDTLGRALIEAGFKIDSSWPVHTENEHSLGAGPGTRRDPREEARGEKGKSPAPSSSANRPTAARRTWSIPRPTPSRT